MASIANHVDCFDGVAVSRLGLAPRMTSNVTAFDAVIGECAPGEEIQDRVVSQLQPGTGFEVARQQSVLDVASRCCCLQGF